MIQNISKTLINELTLNIENLVCIYIFGSILTKYFNANSDIDIAFLSNQALPKIKTFELAQNLGYLLKRDVDLIDLSLCAKNTLVLAMQILKTGKIIYSANDKKRLFFEDLIFCQYVRLQDTKQK